MVDVAKPAPKAAPEPAPKAVAVDDKAANDERELRKAAAKGGQVVLDPESDASYGARGGLAGDIASNALARDEHLRSHGLDPRDPDPTELPANTVPAGAGAAKPDAK